MTVGILTYRPNLDAHRDFGAAGDGVVDDTAALQNALATLASGNSELYIPAGTYLITAPLVIPLCSYRRIRGAGWGATTIRQATDGVAIISAQTDNTFSITIEELTLEYANQQNAAGATGIEFRLNNVAVPAGFYFWNVRKVQVRQAFDAVGIAGAGVIPVWSCVFDQMEINDAKRSGFRLVSPSSVGMPRLVLRSIRGFNSVASTGEFVRATAVEIAIDDLDLEGWRDTAISIDGASNAKIDGMHLENHKAVSDGANLILLSDGRFKVGNVSVDMDNNIPAQTVQTSIIRLAGTASLFAHDMGHTVTKTAGFVVRFLNTVSTVGAIVLQNIGGASANLFVPNDDATQLSRITILTEANATKPRRGTTANRATAANAGAGGMYYDTTLAKPIWSDGAAWRDAAGVAV